MKTLARIRGLFYKHLMIKTGLPPYIQRLFISVFHKTLKIFFNKNKVKTIQVSRIKASFAASTPALLIGLEGTLLDRKEGGEYEILESLLHYLSHDDVAWDIGASMGVFTVLMALKAGPKGEIWAFEPERKSFEILRTNIQLNQLKNVHPLKLALGNRVEKGRLYTYGHGFGPANLSGHGENFEEVEIVPGDLVIKENHLRLPRVIKIDVEGYEHSVIQGLENTLRDLSCEMICCEIHPALLQKGISEKDVIHLLKSFGFNRFETSLRPDTYHCLCYKT